MHRMAILAIGLLLLASAGAWAQQNKEPPPPGALGAITPGVPLGTTGTAFNIPGLQQMPAMPGGGIALGAGTQDEATAPNNLRNFNNSAAPSTR